MPDPIEELFIRVGLDFRQALSDASQGTGQLGQVLGRLEQRFPRLSRVARVAFTTVAISIGVATAAATALAAAIFVVVKASSESVKLAKEQIAAERQRGAVLKSTGNITGFTTEQFNKMASELQNITNIGDEATIGVQALLLTFTRIGREVFPRALATILDVSVAMGQDLKTSAIQVGKALNDPINGVGALTRVGIQFSEQQKEQIKNFTEMGNLVSAQNIILDELARQFGGSAEAAREADGGVIAFSNSIGDLKELVGRPIVNALARGFKDINNTLADEKVSETLNQWATTLGQLIGLLGEVSLTATNTLLGPNGLIPLISDASNSVTSIVVNGLAGISAIINTGIQGITALIQIAKGERSILDIIPDPESIGSTLAQNFNKALSNLKTSLSESEEDTGVSPFLPSAEGTKQHAELLKDILLDSQAELLDLQAETNEALIENEMEFQQRRTELAERTAQKLEKLAEQAVTARSKAIRNARQELIDLEQETDQDLEQERDEFQRDELRDTEDHLREMRRLRSRFIDDLESAVASRDARRVVDLQRQFQRERREREQDFSVTQGREREDLNLRLTQIRQHEQKKAAEIEQGLQEDLNRITTNEQRKRAEIETSHQQQLAREREAFSERQQQLEQSLSDRLSAIAREMANEQEITEEGAAQVLSALANFFGKGGEIDKLMEDFATRRRQRMTIEVEFEGGSAPTSSSSGGRRPRTRHAPGRGPVAFQHGGSMIARQPTLAMFGEAGPELAQFTPLRNINQQTRRIQLDLNLSGSAPPGIRSADRDQIAGVLVNALIESGLTRS